MRRRRCLSRPPWARKGRAVRRGRRPAGGRPSPDARCRARCVGAGARGPTVHKRSDREGRVEVGGGRRARGLGAFARDAYVSRGGGHGARYGALPRRFNLKQPGDGDIADDRAYPSGCAVDAHRIRRRLPVARTPGRCGLFVAQVSHPILPLGSCVADRSRGRTCRRCVGAAPYARGGRSRRDPPG